MNEETAFDAAIDASRLRQGLVEKLKRDGSLRAARVEEAFRAVPRHLFVPGAPLEQVYRDQAIITKRQNGVGISSSSQPAIMAVMLEQLGLESGQRVLEIGAGTGYNAALLAWIAGSDGEVVTVDIDEDTADNARSHLVAAGFDGVKVICADGGYGYPDAAPYDRIILTVGAWDLLPSWLDQLKPDGRIVLPLSIRHVQFSVAFERAKDHLVGVSVAGCGFMTMRGTFAAPSSDVALGPEPGLSLAIDDPEQADAEAVYRLLIGPSSDRSTGFVVDNLWEGLLLWLCLREPKLCGISAGRDVPTRDVVPYLIGYRDEWRSTFGIHREGTLCTLLRPPGRTPSMGDVDDKPFELFVRQFGPDNTLADHLIVHCHAWDAAGRPGTKGLRIRAYPSESGYVPLANAFVVPKRCTRLVIDWE